MRVYRIKDRIKISYKDVKGEEIVVSFAPLTYEQKKEIVTLMSSGAVDKTMDGIKQGIKYTVKDVTGLDTEDGPYSLKFEGGNLSDESVDDLMNIENASGFLGMVCVSLATNDGVPTEIKDKDGKPLKGVTILKNEVKKN